MWKARITGKTKRGYWIGVAAVAVGLIAASVGALYKTGSHAYIVELTYHAPQTEAEKTLDRILQKDIDDPDLSRFILRTPELRTSDRKRSASVLEHDSPAAKAEYGGFFTASLSVALANVVREEKIRLCGTKYMNGKNCLADYDPIACTYRFDVFGRPFLYKTYESGRDEAVVSYIHVEDRILMSAYYYLKREDGTWKLDGIICSPRLINVPKDAMLKPYIFHAPRTEPEKALAAIQDREREDLYAAVDSFEDQASPGRARKVREIYPDTFSPELIAAWKQAAQGFPARASEFCIYEKVCGIGYDPVSCTGDYPEYFTYRQERAEDQDGQKAIVVTSWQDEGAILATYWLVKTRGKWQVDGIACAGGNRFNIQ